MERLTKRTKTGGVLMASEHEGKYTTEEWFDTWGQDVEVTHWMPLPEVPEVDL